MNTIIMPGFTAEASLLGPSEQYHTLGGSAARIGGGVVLPQFSWCFTSNIYPGVQRCCYCNPWGENCLCRYVGRPTLFPPHNGE